MTESTQTTQTENKTTSPLTKSEVIAQFQADLSQTEKDLEGILVNANRIYNRTTRVIQTVFVTIAMLLVVNMYFIYDFGKGVFVMIDSMEQMYTHFGQVTEEMSVMTESVGKMSDNIELLPQMADKMSSMNTTVSSMNGNVQTMQSEVKLMSNDVGHINNSMTNMSYRFDQVNNNMNNIGYRVHQMSRSVP